MNLGTLTFSPITDNQDLIAVPIQRELEQGMIGDGIFVAAIDPELADTASFCEAYSVSLDISTNCIIVEAKRAGKTWHAACLILASDMIDVNGKVRRHLDARKISFAPKETALALTGMEYGGVTPLGLPKEWPILIDTNVVSHGHLVIGGGIRGSKIAITPESLSALQNATIMDITK